MTKPTFVFFQFSWGLTLCLRWKPSCPPHFYHLCFWLQWVWRGYFITAILSFFKNNSSLENYLEPFKQPLNCMRCVCRVFLSKIIWNRFMVWTLCQNFGLKENLFSVVKYKSIIQLSLGFQCYSCTASQPDALNWVGLSKVFLKKSCGGF